jgi:DNA polymerase-1
MEVEQKVCPNFVNCNGCSGNIFPKSIRQQVPSDIEIMVIGDIPTAMETRRGKYLEGPAADILRQTMQKVGLPIDPKKVHFTTALKCAVPKRKGKQISSDTMRNCHAHIVEEIKAINPLIVLVLGKTACQTVYGDTNIKITSIMGRVVHIPGVQPDIICVPILHPALLQHSPADYKPFLASLQLVATLYKGGAAYDTGETKWQVLRTEEEVDKAIKFLSTKKRVSADMETTGLDYRIAEFCVLGIGFEKNKVLIIPRELRHRIQDFFDIPNLKWTWQHGKYDTKVIWRRRLGIVPLDHDAMYMHYTLDETSEHNLEHLSKVFLQAEAYKYKMNQNFKAVTLATYPSFFESLCERVAVDCDYTFQLEDVLLAELDKEPNLRKLYDTLIMPAAPFLARVEQNGILLDPELLETFGAAYDIQLERLKAEIKELAAPYWNPALYVEETGAKSTPKFFNPGSPDQMSWMVFKSLKLKPRRRKGTGTDKDVLNSITPQHPLVAKVLEYRSVAKERSTYVTGLLNWRDIDGRVRTNFSLQVTATGRLSSKEPNVQNLPNAFGVGKIRRAIIAPKRKILMDSDYSGAELRWLACVSKCPVLLDIFRSGKNIHHETSVDLYGKNYTSQDKMRAKAFNFGIPYGREAGSIAEEFNIPKTDAERQRLAWLDKYWGARDFLQYCADSVVKGYYLETPFGRRRRFGLVTQDSLHALQNEARNFPIQSPSSDTTLIAGMELESIVAKYGAVINNLVHDSLLFELPAEHDLILEMGYVVNQHMIKIPERLFGYDVPFESDTDIGFTWADLVGLQFDDQSVKWEEKVDGNKIEKTDNLKEWLYREEQKHSHKYEKIWYTSLQPVVGGKP